MVRGRGEVRVDERGGCFLQAVCRAASRMEAVALLRSEGVGGVSSRRLEVLGSAADERDLGLGHVALGDVWVRSAPPADAWTRRRRSGKDDG